MQTRRVTHSIRLPISSHNICRVSSDILSTLPFLRLQVHHFLTVNSVNLPRQPLPVSPRACSTRPYSHHNHYRCNCLRTCSTQPPRRLMSLPRPPRLSNLHKYTYNTTQTTSYLIILLLTNICSDKSPTHRRSSPARSPTRRPSKHQYTATAFSSTLLGPSKTGPPRITSPVLRTSTTDLTSSYL